MAGTSMKDIKVRIKSVENTMHITKAMELVASSKLIKAKKRLETSKVFFEILQNTLLSIAKNNTELSTVYTKSRGVKKTCLVVIAGDRGLAGGYNSNIFKTVSEAAGDKPFCTVPIGKKAVDFFEKKGAELLSNEYASVESLSISDCYNLSNMLAEEYKKGTFDRLSIVYTKFVSMLCQEPCVIEILPFKTAEKTGGARALTNYEPDAETVFNSIALQYISGLLYGAVSEALASEQGARRGAMESASKNAGEMIDDLNLKFNRARQSAITQEITEIVSGAEAL